MMSLPLKFNLAKAYAAKIVVIIVPIVETIPTIKVFLIKTKKFIDFIALE